MSDILPGDSKRSFSNLVSEIGGKITDVFKSDDDLEPLTPVDSVDLERYAGLWYELARLPMRYQADITTSTAEYTLNDDGTVGVRNTSYRGAETEAVIEGKATPAEGAEKSTNRFIVTFGGLLRFIPHSKEGNYWVLRIADDYSMALVGVPDRGAMWLLSRAPSGYDSKMAKDFLDTADDQGFDTTKLLIANWDSRVTTPITELVNQTDKADKADKAADKADKAADKAKG